MSPLPKVVQRWLISVTRFVIGLMLFIAVVLRLVCTHPVGFLRAAGKTALLIASAMYATALTGVTPWGAILGEWPSSPVDEDFIPTAQLIWKVMCPTYPGRLPLWLPRDLRALLENGSTKLLTSNATTLKENDGESWLFVNGILTTESTCRRNQSMLEDLFGRRIDAVHNESDGFLVDLLESLSRKCRCCRMRPRTL